MAVFQSLRLWLVLTFSVGLFLVGGISLLIRDLAGLPQSRAQQLEELGLVLKDLISVEEIENSLETKNLAERSLTRRLQTLRARISAQTEISLIYKERDQWRILESSRSDWKRGDPYPYIGLAGSHALEQDLPTRSALEEREQGHWISAWLPLEGSSVILSLDSLESGLFYRSRSLLLNYIAMALAILAMAGLAFWWLTRKLRLEKLQLARLEAECFDRNSKALCLMDSQSRVLKANTSFALLLHSNPHDLKNRSLTQDFGEDFRFELDGKAISEFRVEAGNEDTEFLCEWTHRSGERKLLQVKMKKLLAREKKSPALLELQEAERNQTSLRDLRGSTPSEPQFLDSLTGLPNREYLFYNLQSLQKAAELEGCLLLVDLDRFSHFNELFGRESGDSALLGWAEFLLAYFRQTDLVVRFEGDSFAVLLPQTAFEDATRLAHNLKAALKECPNTLIQNMSFSVGVTRFQDNESLPGWMARSEIALQRAMDRGFGQIQAEN